jgi:hypothetical protein
LVFFITHLTGTSRLFEVFALEKESFLETSGEVIEDKTTSDYSWGRPVRPMNSPGGG